MRVYCFNVGSGTTYKTHSWNISIVQSWIQVLWRIKSKEVSDKPSWWSAQWWTWQRKLRSYSFCKLCLGQYSNAEKVWFYLFLFVLPRSGMILLGETHFSLSKITLMSFHRHGCSKNVMHGHLYLPKVPVHLSCALIYFHIWECRRHER